ncbi:MAG: hypothetical protein HS116_18055 [Planctomycetes bacterium]|nr:hypothetical protein [Planctomycetota bacterium]
MTSKAEPIDAFPNVSAEVARRTIRERLGSAVRTLGSLIFGLGVVLLMFVTFTGASFVPGYFEPHVPGLAGCAAGLVVAAGIVICHGRFSLLVLVGTLLLIPAAGTLAQFVSEQREGTWEAAGALPNYLAQNNDIRLLRRALIPAIYPEYGPSGHGAPLRFEAGYLIHARVHADPRLRDLIDALARYGWESGRVYGLAVSDRIDRGATIRLAVADLCDAVEALYGPDAAYQFSQRAIEYGPEPAWQAAYTAEAAARALRLD